MATETSRNVEIYKKATSNIYLCTHETTTTAEIKKRGIVFIRKCASKVTVSAIFIFCTLSH